VPEPGRLAIVSASNGWNDADPCPGNACGYRIGSGPEWNKVIDDFSGGVYNPHWGPLGALMLHGGGHAATNDNSVAVLDFNDLTFKRVADPSLEVTGIRPADGPAYPGYDREYGEYVVDRKPAAAHTYDALEVVPPEIAGAPFGGLVRPFSTAIHVNLSSSVGWAHLLQLHSREVATPQDRARNVWTRASANAGQGFGGAGGACAYDRLRRRVWWTGVPSSRPQRIAYLDAVTRQQVSVRHSGADAIFDVSFPVMRYLPGHDLLVAIGPRPDRSSIDAYFLRPGQPEAGWRAISLTSAIPAGAGATPWDFVPELNRIFVHSRGDAGAIYEIEVPAVPETFWTPVRRVFQGESGLISPASVVGKRFSWAPALRSFVFKPMAAAPSLAQFYVYRPSGL
jgi:hypothetical protein